MGNYYAFTSIVCNSCDPTCSWGDDFVWHVVLLGQMPDGLILLIRVSYPQFIVFKIMKEVSLIVGEKNMEI